MAFMIPTVRPNTTRLQRLQDQGRMCVSVPSVACARPDNKNTGAVAARHSKTGEGFENICCILKHNGSVKDE